MKNCNILKRLGYAYSGIAASLRSEDSFRVQAISFLLVVAVLFFVRPAPVWWAVLLLASGGVLALELVNTALEKLIDHLHPAQHPAIKVVKDTLAGAVLVMAVTALLIFAAFICQEVGL